MNIIHRVSKDDSGPSIPEMREMLARGPYLDTYPHVEHQRVCHRCGNAKPDFWIIINHERYCNICGASQ